jgi:hypothetical protein
MKHIKLLAAIALFGIVISLSLVQDGNYKSADDDDTSPPARLSFLISGGLDETQYTYTEVSDTLQSYVSSVMGGEDLPVHWGLNLGSMQTNEGQWVQVPEFNLNGWAQVSFSDATRRMHWLKSITLQPGVKIYPPSGGKAMAEGHVDLHLPMVDGSGRWLHLSGLRYAYITT